MSIKLSPIEIISDHLATLKNHGEATPSKVDTFVFCILPAVFAFLGVKFYRAPVGGDGEFAVVVFSILIGLLLNLQVLIFSLTGKVDTEVDLTRQKTKKLLLSETSANVSFSILCAILFCGSSLYLRYIGTDFFEIVFFVSLYFGWSFALTLMMILKRVHVLLSEELK